MEIRFHSLTYLALSKGKANILHLLFLQDDFRAVLFQGLEKRTGTVAYHLMKDSFFKVQVWIGINLTSFNFNLKSTRAESSVNFARLSFNDVEYFSVIFLNRIIQFI